MSTDDEKDMADDLQSVDENADDAAENEKSIVDAEGRRVNLNPGRR